MKIGLMSAWNSDSGASLHAELIGRELVKMGHVLSVFSFYKYDFHGTALIGEDEAYVTRCFTTSRAEDIKLNPVPILTADYDIFIVEDLGMLPVDQLGKIFHRIKRKAKTLTIIHDGKLSENPAFYQFDWDSVVGFDRRYIDFLKELYPIEILREIPYPCHPIETANKEIKRKELGLPADRKIVFMFGPASGVGMDTIPWLTDLESKYSLLVLVVTSNKAALEKANLYRKRSFVQVREETLTISQLYDYLHAADALILNKESLPHVAVSSTIFQCLGSGCPIIAKDSNFVEIFNGEVMKYIDKEEFLQKLIDVFECGDNFVRAVEAGRRYVKKNSPNPIAKRYFKLFEELLEV